MSISGSASPAAEAIADGHTPDLSTLTADEGRLEAYRILADIAGSFRRDDPQRGEAPREVLFTWRHLEVVEAIGAGAFGEVYRAYDPVLHRHVALKLARDDPERRLDPRMVIAEARRMARLRHPNILAVHGADEDGGRVGVWCDLLRGRTLARILDERQVLSPREVLAVAIPLAGALALVHRRGLAHGDVKPANVMVEPDGTPVLMDFGAAREGPGRSPVIGSPLFMAPEQFDGRPASAATDVYAFGALLYTALTARPPIAADSLDQLQALHQAAAAPDFGNLPLGYRSLLRDLLAHRPGDRPGAAEVLRRLERIRTARSRWLRRAALAAVIVSLAAGAIASLSAYRSEARSRDRIERVKDVMAEAAESVVPTRQSGPTSVVAMYETMAGLIEERLADYPDALAEMRLVTGVGLGKLGETRRGLEIAEAGMALMVEVRPDSWRDIASGWLELATLRALVEDTSGTEQAVRNALAALEGIESEAAASERLVAMNRLALLLGQQGRWHEEVAATEQLLADRRALYGPDSIRLAVDHHNLAGAQASIGDLDSALANEHRAAELLRAEGDEDSVRMGFVQFALANMMISAGRFDEARAALDEVARIYAANLPAGHMNFEILAEGEARWLVEAGRFDEAVPTLERLLTLEGEEFAQTRLKAGRDLARVRMHQGRWAEAEQLFREVRRDRPERHRPLDAYFEAAIAYTGFKAGALERPPMGTLDAALAALRRDALTRLAEYRRLEAWRADLESGTPAE